MLKGPQKSVISLIQLIAMSMNLPKNDTEKWRRLILEPTIQIMKELIIIWKLHCYYTIS